MTIQIKNPAELLGKVINSREVLDYFASLDSTSSVKKSTGTKSWISKPAGMEVDSEETTDRVTDVFLHNDGYEGFRRYAGPIPHGITFDMNRDQVRRTMKSPPDYSDQGGSLYDTWDLSDHRFIVNYEKSGRIRRISLTGDF